MIKNATSILTIGALLAVLPLHAAPASREAASHTSQTEPVLALEHFLAALSQGQFEEAYSLVAPSSKANGDPIAYRAPLDFESFVMEIKSPAKFERCRYGESKWQSSDCFRQLVNLDGWDNDETMIVLEGGHWYVADPIHIIR